MVWWWIKLKSIFNKSNLFFKSASVLLNFFMNGDSNVAYRSSRPEVFCEKVVLRNFAKFTGTHLCQSLFLNKVAGLWYRCFPVKVLRTSFHRTPLVATPVLRWCSIHITIIVPLRWFYTRRNVSEMSRDIALAHA